jgi:hypothetical protein
MASGPFPPSPIAAPTRLLGIFLGGPGIPEAPGGKIGAPGFAQAGGSGVESGVPVAPVLSIFGR